MPANFFLGRPDARGKAPFLWRLISRQKGRDHNDIAFGFYIPSSIWWYCEYLWKLRWYRAVLVGMFAGGAVLNKRRMGLLVYAACGGKAISDGIKDRSFRGVRPLLGSLPVCVLVFLPQEPYILRVYTEQARCEYNYNAKHLFQGPEGHTGDVLHCVKHVDRYSGRNLWLLGTLGLRFVS